MTPRSGGARRVGPAGPIIPVPRRQASWSRPSLRGPERRNTTCSGTGMSRPPMEMVAATRLARAFSWSQTRRFDCFTLAALKSGGPAVRSSSIQGPRHGGGPFAPRPRKAFPARVPGAKNGPGRTCTFSLPLKRRLLPSLSYGPAWSQRPVPPRDLPLIGRMLCD